MSSVIATIKVKEDKVDEARKFLAELAGKVLENEPGTLAYVVHQQKDDPTTFVFYEKYADEAATKVHRENLAKVGPQFAELLAGRPDIVRIEEI